MFSLISAYLFSFFYWQINLSIYYIIIKFSIFVIVEWIENHLFSKYSYNSIWQYQLIWIFFILILGLEFIIKIWHQLNLRFIDYFTLYIFWRSESKFFFFNFFFIIVTLMKFFKCNEYKITLDSISCWFKK